MYGQSEPWFNYRSQFPVLMTPEVIDKLEKFTFVLEVWDEVSPGRHDLVGLVKVPLASFCYSMKTTEDDIFSLNFLLLIPVGKWMSLTSVLLLFTDVVGPVNFELWSTPSQGTSAPCLQGRPLASPGSPSC